MNVNHYPADTVSIKKIVGDLSNGYTWGVMNPRPPKIESVKIWRQIVTEISLVCQIIFCPNQSVQYNEAKLQPFKDYKP